FEVAGGHQIPPHVLAHLHGQARCVAIQKPVDRFPHQGSKGAAGLPVRIPRAPLGATISLTLVGSLAYRAMFSSRYGLSLSSSELNAMTISRSTSFGAPSGLAIRRAVMIIGPTSPAFASAISLTCE